MDALCDEAAALALMKPWGWLGFDRDSGSLSPIWKPLSDAVNQLAMEGHTDPASAILSLLANGQLVATGDYQWEAYRNGHFRRAGTGIIPSRRWAVLKHEHDAIGDFGPFKVTLRRIGGDRSERKESRANWEWKYDRFSTAQTSGGNPLSENFFEETYSAFDIEIRPGDKKDNVAEQNGQSGPAVERNKGGAPTKYDWERAVAAIVFQWADEGSWQPEIQADVKKRLADWFAEQDLHPADSMLKERARWLFAEFQRWNDKADNLSV
ncbi:MAG: hypothetical protein WA978_10760 [Sphingopyxis granuli]|uniref:hypothetical protein n=1 Tax=Sphingopyxis granuli TaxID=267128 RepID=UPI003C761152